jgi:hypothetical protein
MAGRNESGESEGRDDRKPIITSVMKGEGKEKSEGSLSHTARCS